MAPEAAELPERELPDWELPESEAADMEPIAGFCRYAYWSGRGSRLMSTCSQFCPPMNIGIGICTVVVELLLEELLPLDEPPPEVPPPPPPEPVADRLLELLELDELFEPLEVVEPPLDREPPLVLVEPPLREDEEFDDEEVFEEEPVCEEPGEPPGLPPGPPDDELLSEATAGGTTNDAGSGCSTQTAARKSPAIRSSAARANCASATSLRPL